MPSVFFVTLSRSDYASLRPVARAALVDLAIDAKIIVGGSHLLARYGRSIEQVERDVPIHASVAFLNEADDSPAELAQAYARAVTEFVRVFTEKKPDAIFIVGDRWEMLAVASAASMLGIPIVHHSGGDITQGSADNQTRYAISCLAHLHLVALPEHRKRLLAMGEEEWRVITTGEPALTELAHYAVAVPDIHGQLGLQAGEAFVLATFHPTSFDALPAEKQIDIFLQALDGIKQRIVLTAPNPDAGSGAFWQKLQAYASAHAHVKLHESLGAEVYYAAMGKAKFMIGNSSSGLWEAPSFKLPVVNIGARQQGRAHGDNVVNVPLDTARIAAAVARVSDPAFRQTLSGENPYLRADTLALIIGALRQKHDKSTLLAKRFMDPLHADPGR